MKKRKILFGICGLGNGHTFRQFPLVEYFSKKYQVMIFAHDNSFDFYAAHFKKNPNVKIIQVTIPFYVGNKDGLDFKASANHPINQKEIFKINCLALDRATKELGQPDLVITDYESVSAQYAYATGAPLVTIDQQSKFLCGKFPKELGGFNFKDEVKRLNMFFPRVQARIALSFFNFSIKPQAQEVKIFAPTIRKEITELKRQPKKDSILVYISSAREFGQTWSEVLEIFAKRPEINFQVFLGEKPDLVLPTNVKTYKHGDKNFLSLISQCSGIIATAGHSLLSEAVYLGIPVLAIPIAPYEQHLNALAIKKNHLGVSEKKLSNKTLDKFIKGLPKFEKNLKSDNKYINRRIGQNEIIAFLETRLKKGW